MNHKISEKELRNSTGDINSNRNSDRFCSSTAAIKYPAQFRSHHFHDWAERIAIMRALEYVQKGAKVLDFPCGTGRLTNLLLEDGFILTSADRSIEMLKIAKQNYEQFRSELIIDYPQVKFHNEDLIAGTKFEDMQFDAVVCHRLFHHLVESETRILAIKELKRITRKFIIFSFFNSHCCSAGIKAAKNFIKHNNPTDRVPISKQTIIAELENQNMKVVKIISRLWGISPLCIVIAQRK